MTQRLALMPLPKIQFFDNDGNPLDGGLVYTYLAGSSTPAATYADASGAVANTNPVVLDSAGRASIFLNGYYRIVLTDAAGLTIYTQDNVSSMPDTIFPSSEWVAQAITVTYVSGTQFSTVGDYTSLFLAGLELEATLGSGLITGTVSSSSYSSGTTTITVVWDAGASLDSSLSAIATRVVPPGTSGSAPFVPVAGTVCHLSWFDNFASAITKIGSAAVSLLIDQPQTLTASISIPSTLGIEFLPGCVITKASSYTITSARPITAGRFQIFAGFSPGDVTGVVECYPEWWGVDAAAINCAQGYLTAGGKITLTQTYTVASGAIVISNSGIELELLASCTIDNTTGTDFTIKVTGTDFRMTGSGKVQVPNSPVCASPGLTSLRKACIWITGHRALIEGIIFQNSISYTIFGEGADDLQILKNRFLGAYTSYTLSDGTNHFAFYRDGGSRTTLRGNYVENYAQGFGSGWIGAISGDKMDAWGNEFVGIGNHPIYTASGADNSSYIGNTSKACGGAPAFTGSNIVSAFNTWDMADPSKYGAQAGMSFRNSMNCMAIAETFTGYGGGRTILSADNTGAGTSIQGVKFAHIHINMTSGTVYNAVVVGTAGVTTLIDDITLEDISVSGLSQDASTALTGMIYMVPSAAGQITNWKIEGCRVKVQSTATGISVKWAAGGRCSKNKVYNTTTYGTSTTIYGLTLNQCHDVDVDEFTAETTTSTNLTFTDFRELGTSAQVYNNRFTKCRTNSAIAGSSNTGPILIAGNGSQIKDYYNNDKVNTNTGSTLYLKDGSPLFLTASGGARGVNPYASYPWPTGYILDIFNVDGTYTISFDTGGINKSIAAGKHGQFSYTGSAWAGGQVD